MKSIMKRPYTPLKKIIKKKVLTGLTILSTSHKMFMLVVVSTILGALCGIIFPEQMLSLCWIDIIFINLLKVASLPLMFFSIVSSIILLSKVKSLKLVWFYTACYFMISLAVAVLIGIVLSNLFKPGLGMSANHILLNVIKHENAQTHMSPFIDSLFPPGILIFVSEFAILPIVLFSIVFGIACVSVGESAKTVTTFFIGMRNVFNKLIVWLMYLTPIGLFAMLGSAIAEDYTRETLLLSIRGLSLFILIVLVGLFIQFLWHVAVVKYLIRRSPREFIFGSSSALLMAFATASSIVTLPITLLVASEQKIKPEIANFVLPISLSVNLAGTAMYEAVATLFFCQILGMHLSLASEIGIFFTSIMAGMCAGGIPEGGLVTMSLVLRSVNVPTSAIALLLPFDRILDRLRTVVNVWGDLVGAAVVDKLVIDPTVEKVRVPSRNVALLDEA